MRRYIALLLLLFPLFLGGCSKTPELEFTSFRISSVKPQGFASVEVVVQVGINNPRSSFEVREMRGSARLNGVPLMSLSADMLSVSGKCEDVYTVPVYGEIASGFNVFDLLQSFDSKFNADDVTVDFSGILSKRGGSGRKVEMKDIPLSKILRK